MWDTGVSLASIVINSLWGFALFLIGLGWLFDIAALGQFGIFLCALGATLTTIRDNQRTRRLLKRPIDQIASPRRSRQD